MGRDQNLQSAHSSAFLCTHSISWTLLDSAFYYNHGLRYIQHGFLLRAPRICLSITAVHPQPSLLDYNSLAIFSKVRVIACKSRRGSATSLHAVSLSFLTFLNSSPCSWESFCSFPISTSFCEVRSLSMGWVARILDRSLRSFLLVSSNLFLSDSSLVNAS